MPSERAIEMSGTLLTSSSSLANTLLYPNLDNTLPNNTLFWFNTVPPTTITVVKNATNPFSPHSRSENANCPSSSDIKSTTSVTGSTVAPYEGTLPYEIIHTVKNSLKNAADGAKAQKNLAIVSSYAGGFFEYRSSVTLASWYTQKQNSAVTGTSNGIAA